MFADLFIIFLETFFLLDNATKIIWQIPAENEVEALFLPPAGIRTLYRRRLKFL